MGKNTLLSFPDSKPLPKRTNIVLSSKAVFDNDCIVVRSLDELFSEINKYPSENVFIIGGAMLYHAMLEYVDSVLVTKVDADGNADVFFDNLDENSNWKQISSSEPIDDNGYRVVFTEYQNLNKKTYGE